jgi:hypothetical protein
MEGEQQVGFLGGLYDSVAVLASESSVRRGRCNCDSQIF